MATIAMSNPRLANNSDIIYTYRNLDKKINYGGIDIGLDLPLAARWMVGATYSYVNKSIFPEIETSPGVPLLLNAPKNKGSLTLDYGDVASVVQLQTRPRYTEGFAVRRAVWSIIGTNVLNAYAPTFAGAPGIGRSILTRLRYVM